MTRFRFQLVFRKVIDVIREKELAERNKNEPPMELADDHPVRRLISRFRKMSYTQVNAAASPDTPDELAASPTPTSTAADNEDDNETNPMCLEREGVPEDNGTLTHGPAQPPPPPTAPVASKWTGLLRSLNANGSRNEEQGHVGGEGSEGGETNVHSRPHFSENKGFENNEDPKEVVRINIPTKSGDRKDCDCLEEESDRSLGSKESEINAHEALSTSDKANFSNDGDLKGVEDLESPEKNDEPPEVYDNEREEEEEEDTSQEKEDNRHQSSSVGVCDQETIQTDSEPFQVNDRIYTERLDTDKEENDDDAQAKYSHQDTPKDEAEANQIPPEHLLKYLEELPVKQRRTTIRPTNIRFCPKQVSNPETRSRPRDTRMLAMLNNIKASLQLEIEELHQRMDNIDHHLDKLSTALRPPSSSSTVSTPGGAPWSPTEATPYGRRRDRTPSDTYFIVSELSSHSISTDMSYTSAMTSTTEIALDLSTEDCSIGY